MIGFVRGMWVTMGTMFRKPVTVQYPQEHITMSPRNLGFPVLLWDDNVNEPACTGCQVCMRYCPTDCITVEMKDNPLHTVGKSPRRKIVEDFQIREERCILCGICVEVCNFDAILMSDFHEEADLSRGGMIMTKERLLEMGRDLQKRKGIVVGAGSETEE
ncbi:MAG: NADH-quinone oxidoreductase subunit I [Chloroflexi bacterium]|nr:NADH-quinone oxidoreductase subunit I [Chloroflexota bacterium]